MKNLLEKTFIGSLCLAVVMVFLAGCEYDTDGPLKPSSGDLSFDKDGFFYGAALDSGKTIHLLKDTLYVDLSYIWSFSNCALQSIKFGYSKQDSVLVFKPSIKIHATEEECASPYYRPDTTIKLVLDDELTSGVGEIRVKNDKDSIAASIKLRRGTFKSDTFQIYLDSAFLDKPRYPIRTKSEKDSKVVPTVLRVLDSLTPRYFFWRTIESTCAVRVDMCDDVVADTIYPSSWNINDTSLVPVHYACADSDLIYCVSGKWQDDSTKLGSLEKRQDTIWHYSTYYVEKIPRCASYNSFSVSNLLIGQTALFTRQLMVPDEDETFCGPASRDEWMVYNLSSNKMVLDTGSVRILDGVLKSWDEADVAPDTLISKD